MEPQSPDSVAQEELTRTEETILPPEIIRPLGRALIQRLSPNIDSLRKILPSAQTAGLNEFAAKLQKLEKAKEVKLIKDMPTDPEDFPTFGIDTSKELESEVNISPSTTVIEKPLMPDLGIALQDYLMSSVNSIRGSNEVDTRISSIVSFLRAVTRSQRIIITNTKTTSTFND